jgi:hypothetical protein
MAKMKAQEQVSIELWIALRENRACRTCTRCSRSLQTALMRYKKFLSSVSILPPDGPLQRGSTWRCASDMTKSGRI